MSEKTTRVDDIVRTTGIGEEEVRRYLKEYDAFLEYRKVGKARLYAGSAIGAVEEIAALSAAGLSRDEIAARIGKGGERRKSARPRPPAPPVSVPSPAAAEAPALGIRQSSLVDTVAFLDQRIKKLQGRIESLEAALASAEREHGEERAVMEAVLDDRDLRIRLIDEWIGYFEKRLDSFETRDAAFAASVREWIEYVDASIDELSLSALERIRRRMR